VELPSVGQDQIAHWLSETAGTQEAAVRNATSHLEAAQNVPKFALCLLMLAAGKQSVLCSVLSVVRRLQFLQRAFGD
jgi:hypothetical protein